MTQAKVNDNASRTSKLKRKLWYYDSINYLLHFYRQMFCGRISNGRMNTCTFFYHIHVYCRLTIENISKMVQTVCLTCQCMCDMVYHLQFPGNLSKRLIRVRRLIIPLCIAYFRRKIGIWICPHTMLFCKGGKYVASDYSII